MHSRRLHNITTSEAVSTLQCDSQQPAKGNTQGYTSLCPQTTGLGSNATKARDVSEQGSLQSSGMDPRHCQQQANVAVTARAAISKPIILFVTAMLSAGAVGDYKPAQRAVPVVGRFLEEPMSVVSALLPARLVLNKQLVRSNSVLSHGKVGFQNGWRAQ